MDTGDLVVIFEGLAVCEAEEVICAVALGELLSPHAVNDNAKIIIAV